MHPRLSARAAGLCRRMLTAAASVSMNAIRGDCADPTKKFKQTKQLEQVREQSHPAQQPPGPGSSTAGAGIAVWHARPRVQLPIPVCRSCSFCLEVKVIYRADHCKCGSHSGTLTLGKLTAGQALPSIQAAVMRCRPTPMMALVYQKRQSVTSLILNEPSSSTSL